MSSHIVGKLLASLQYPRRAIAERTHHVKVFRALLIV